MLFTLTYISREIHPLAPAEVAVLARQAARDNLRRSLTGVLLYADGLFVQRLEGKRADVMDLYGRIRRDERHEVLMVTSANDLDERLFDGWGMALIDSRTLGTDDSDTRALVASLPDTVRAHPDAAEEMAMLLRSVLVA